MKTLIIKIKNILGFKLIVLLLAIIYFFLALKSLSPFWFNPNWTTNDAFQQVYPFHKVLIPELFKDDPLTNYIELYLPLFHYYLCYGITYLFGDSLLMSHIVMGLQIGLIFLFMFLAIKNSTNSTIAILASTWIIHSRRIIERSTAGLPRGWLTVVLACFLYLLSTKKYRTILLLLFIASLFNQPATLIITLSYGLFLSFKVLIIKTRKEFLPHFIHLIIVAPFLLLLTYFTTQKPIEIGQMVSLEEALQLPAFGQKGRFHIIPLKSVSKDLNEFATSAFTTKNNWYKTPLKNYSFLFLVILLSALTYFAIKTRKNAFLTEGIACLCATLIAYFLARLLAFKLFIPNRYLLVPMGLFSIFFITTVSYQILRNKNATNNYKVLLFNSFLAISIYTFSGSGLYGTWNFDSNRENNSLLWNWLETNTSPNDIIAGHPDFTNGLPLWAKRQTYITTELAHPFYSEYRRVTEGRLTKFFKAYYTDNFEEFKQFLINENISYFIFKKSDFTKKAFKRAHYREPINQVVRTLVQNKDISKLVFFKIISNKENIIYENDEVIIYKHQ